jgi:hypothetical protein
MGVGHQQTIPTYHGFVTVGGASVNGNTFPYDGTISNSSQGGFPPVLEILGRGRDHCSWKDLNLVPDSGAVHYGAIGSQPAIFADDDILFDGNKRRNMCALTNPGFGVNLG